MADLVRRGRLGPRALALALALAAACGGPDEAPSGDGGEGGASREPAPDFALSALDGGTVRLESFRGTPVVVDFWATWCAPCVHQVPVLNDFQAAHPEDVVVLGVSVDTDGAEAVAAFAEEHDIRYRVLLGTPELARRYGALGFPTLYLIAPDGGIAMAHVGVATAPQLEEALAELRASAGSGAAP